MVAQDDNKWAHQMEMIMPENYKPIAADVEFQKALAKVMARQFIKEMRQEKDRLHERKRKLKRISKASKKRNRPKYHEKRAIRQSKRDTRIFLGV